MEEIKIPAWIARDKDLYENTDIFSKKPDYDICESVFDGELLSICRLFNLAPGECIEVEILIRKKV